MLFKHFLGTNCFSYHPVYADFLTEKCLREGGTALPLATPEPPRHPVTARHCLDDIALDKVTWVSIGTLFCHSGACPLSSTSVSDFRSMFRVHCLVCKHLCFYRLDGLLLKKISVSQYALRRRYFPMDCSRTSADFNVMTKISFDNKLCFNQKFESIL